MVNAAERIDALSVAGEFLLCAIRALAVGQDFGSQAVQDPINWALAKIRESTKDSTEGDFNET